MSKRLKLSSGNHQQQHMEAEDQISRLPDELLVKIVSILTLREAGRTSVLSTRWKTLWTFITGNPDLEFDGRFALSIINGHYSLEYLEEGRRQYSEWVNKVTKSHKGGQIGGLKVCFDLDSTCKSDLDSWIEFAVQKKSAVLDISLDTSSLNELYRFPQHVLSNSNIKLIKAIHLCYVDVSGPVLEDIISKCPLLNALSVSCSETLTGGVSVSGSGKDCFLKYIEIRNCNNLEYIQISAPNLESLVFFGRSTTSIRIRDAPKLWSLQVGGFYCADRFPLFPEFSRFFSQLDMLVLDYSMNDTWNIILPEFPQLKILKNMVLKLPAYDRHSLLFFVALIKACPMLRVLKVEFEWWTTGEHERKVEKIELEEKERFKCLESVDFKYFAGRATDIELVSCILENAPNIETIFMEMETQSTPLEKYDRLIEMRAARLCAKQLANKHSPSARFVMRS